MDYRLNLFPYRSIHSNPVDPPHFTHPPVRPSTYNGTPASTGTPCISIRLNAHRGQGQRVSFGAPFRRLSEIARLLIGSVGVRRQKAVIRGPDGGHLRAFFNAIRFLRSSHRMNEKGNGNPQSDISVRTAYII